MNDEHSPNKNRVNAVLSSIDKFYEVYNIKEKDKMYVAKKTELKSGKIKYVYNKRHLYKLKMSFSI